MRGSLKMRGVISPEHQLRVCLAWLSPCRGMHPEQSRGEQSSFLCSGTPREEGDSPSLHAAGAGRKRVCE